VLSCSTFTADCSGLVALMYGAKSRLAACTVRRIGSYNLRDVASPEAPARTVSGEALRSRLTEQGSALEQQA
jgi:hypothetical protein